MNDHLDNETREYMNEKAKAALLDAKRLFMQDAPLEEIGAALDEAAMYAGTDFMDYWVLGLQNDILRLEADDESFPEYSRKTILEDFNEAMRECVPEGHHLSLMPAF